MSHLNILQVIRCIIYYKNTYINKYTGLFITRILNKSIKNSGFGYAMRLTGTRSDKNKINLPVDSNGEPDWQFMDNYIRAIESKQIKNFINFII